MLTICWAAKGGSGTSVTCAALTLTGPTPSVAVDLAGDLPQIFGLGEPDVPGFLNWMGSDASVDRLPALEIPLATHRRQTGDHADAVGATHRLIHRGNSTTTPVSRWHDAARYWHESSSHVIVDAGTSPPSALLDVPFARRLLVTHQCYLSIRAASRSQLPIDGIILIDEPGRSLRVDDIELALAAPVVARLLSDPAIARAVDAGLLTSRLPRSVRRCARDLMVSPHR